MSHTWPTLQAHQDVALSGQTQNTLSLLEWEPPINFSKAEVVLFFMTIFCIRPYNVLIFLFNRFLFQQVIDCYFWKSGCSTPLLQIDFPKCYLILFLPMQTCFMGCHFDLPLSFTTNNCARKCEVMWDYIDWYNVCLERPCVLQIGQFYCTIFIFYYKNEGHFVEKVGKRDQGKSCILCQKGVMLTRMSLFGTRGLFSQPVYKYSTATWWHVWKFIVSSTINWHISGETHLGKVKQVVE